MTNDFCPGCGYYWYTHDRTHRADCTAKPKQDNITQPSDHTYTTSEGTTN